MRKEERKFILDFYGSFFFGESSLSVLKLNTDEDSFQRLVES
jgi:hypothetical protein